MTPIRGMTLLELIVTLSVVVVLATVTVPAFSDFLRDNRLISDLHHFRGQLMLSRSLAIKTAGEVVMCTSNGDSCNASRGWADGWMIFADRDGNRQCMNTDKDGACDGDGGRIFVLSRGLDTDSVDVSASGNPGRFGYVRFTARGDASGFLSTFSFCDARGRPASRGLKLIMTGRVVSARPGDPLLRCR